VGSQFIEDHAVSRQRFVAQKQPSRIGVSGSMQALPRYSPKLGQCKPTSRAAPNQLTMSEWFKNPHKTYSMTEFVTTASPPFVEMMDIPG
jgi:hypothetical protein